MRFQFYIVENGIILLPCVILGVNPWGIDVGWLCGGLRIVFVLPGTPAPWEEE